MFPSLNNKSSKPQMCASLLSNYYNDNFHVETPHQEHYHTPSSFLVPSPIYIPLEDEVVFSEFFQQDPFVFNDHDHFSLAHEMTTNAMGECCYNNNGQKETNHGDDDHGDAVPDNDIPTKRPSDRLRHNKINTARGPRDRRIRLSLDVAKKLFWLQDQLGFDKASKTIDWLLTKSKTVILDLLPDRSCSFMRLLNGASSTSELEVVSAKTKAKSSSGNRIKQKDKINGVRKCDPLTKETRVRARQRARKRTIQKQNNYKDAVCVGDQDSNFRQGLDQVMDHDVNALGSSRIVKENEHLIIDQTSSNFQICQGFVGDMNSSLWMTDNCTPSYFLDY